jgi:hypothetical protein
MKVNRVAAVPIITHDPYFSVWAPGDHLYDADTIHWSGLSQKVTGYVTVDGRVVRFLGKGYEREEGIEQTSLDIIANATTYTFENEDIVLDVRFLSPLLLNDLDILARPCTYVDYTVKRKKACDVNVEFVLSDELVQRNKDALNWVEGTSPLADGKGEFAYASMGRAKQKPLGNSGDSITIDWGFAYLACLAGEGRTDFDK